jgi:F-type H+-transporting ATPase subunit b
VLIDWFTVTAQIVNFIVLVVLLKYFLYDRIIEAMDRREQNIRNRLQEAESERQEAEQEAESYRKKNEEMDQKRSEMLDQAKEEAEKERKSLTQKAREEVEKVRSRWHESVQKEKNSFLRDLRQLTAKQVYAISRRALQDLADSELEERLVEVFLSELQNMPEEKKRDMMDAIQKEGNSAVVRSGFEIPTKLRRKITEVLHGSLAENAEVTYETIPDMIMGIELKCHGEKMSWSLENYLADLEERAKETLEKEAQRGGKEEGKEARGKSQDRQEKEGG